MAPVALGRNEKRDGLSKKSTAAPSSVTAPLKLGDHVVIHQNPHDAKCRTHRGHRHRLHTRVGFAGSDLVRVHYKRPLDVQGHTLPFGLSCHTEATPSEVQQIDGVFERQVVTLREIATALRRKKMAACLAGRKCIDTNTLRHML